MPPPPGESKLNENQWGSQVVSMGGEFTQKPVSLVDCVIFFFCQGQLLKGRLVEGQCLNHSGSGFCHRSMAERTEEHGSGRGLPGRGWNDGSCHLRDTAEGGRRIRHR